MDRTTKNISKEKQAIRQRLKEKFSNMRFKLLSDILEDLDLEEGL